MRLLLECSTERGGLCEAGEVRLIAGTLLSRAEVGVQRLECGREEAAMERTGRSGER